MQQLQASPGSDEPARRRKVILALPRAPSNMIKNIAKLGFLVAAPVALAAVFLALVFCDVFCHLRRLWRGRQGASPGSGSPSDPLFEPPRRASIVIPTWNARDLLEKYLPSILEACDPSDEVLVVDNASTDGSAEWIRRCYPRRVRLLPMDRNLGFGGGANAGIQAARHRIAVLLNNDMRVSPGFLAPLLAGFTDETVFAVSAQIFFSDSGRRREETGLTAGWFEKGFLRVRHEIEDRIQKLFPTFYAGGGSTAYDRDKFVALGGFDPLFEPFYLEDADLSYGAWRRGWKVLYQPNSHVYHEHRATIGKHYTPEAIHAYLQKNYVLLVWKDIHRWRWLIQHFCYLYGHMILCWLGRETPTRTSIGAFLMALRQLPQALAARRRALLRSATDDRAIFHLLRPSVFHETFSSRAEETGGKGPPVAGAAGEGGFAAAAPAVAAPRPLRILFVSPYSIYPPVHGGAVLMLQAIRELAKRNQVFVLAFVDSEQEAESNRALEGMVRKVETHVRAPVPNRHFHLQSHAEQTFCDPQFAALLDKLVYLHDIDLIQFEYTQLAQYHLPLRHTPQCLFEHDVYFRSVQRQLFSGEGSFPVKAREFLEWLRAMRYEVAAIAQFDAVFTCHEKEQRLLESVLNGRRPPVFSGLRTAVEVSSYPFPGGPRAPHSLLFVGNFQHRPNAEGLAYFCREVLPLIRARCPQATLTAVGAQAPPQIHPMLERHAVRWLGRVEEIREPLSRHAVFVAPILTGAGVRVKILEAFASGIPVVSTTLGAEGIQATPGTDLLLADSPSAFAAATLNLLERPEAATAMAASARRLVETRYDWPAVGQRLEQVYRNLVVQCGRGGMATG